MHQPPRTSVLVPLSLLLGACGGEASGGGPADEQTLARALRVPLELPAARVMTQNLYIGLDVFPITAAPLAEIPFAVAAGFADFVANRPEERMAAVAREIALIQPELVGLQEVVEVLSQFPSDAIGGNLTPNATEPVVDFLSTLLDELERRGVRYEVAAQQLGADLELPRFDGLVDGAPVFTDVRSRFSDVILRRADVSAEPLFAINYVAALPIPTLPGLEVVRNAVGVTAQVGGETLRFASTHLEPLVEGVPDGSQPQLGQVTELIELLADDALEPELPTVVVGDFNSPAETGASYQLMADAGYSDVWAESFDTGQSGFTCCQSVVLDNPQSLLAERIDYVWTKQLGTRVPPLAVTVGDQPFFRTVGDARLWPSDHAGVAALLVF
jgi:endonuclease/exonuclease/phosphatase family metal-dependent hydrolase